MAQQDQFTTRAGSGYIPTHYAPQVTLQYKTFVKRTMVEAITNAFKGYADQTLRRAKIGPDYVTDRMDFPSVVIKFYEQDLRNAGVGHMEWGSAQEDEELKAKVTLTEGSNEVTGVAATYLFNPGETKIAGHGIPAGTFVQAVLSESRILISNNATATGYTEVTFTDVFVEKYLEYHHYLYHGDIAFEIFGLSSLDRDKTADAIVEVVAMGSVGPEGKTFQERLYGSVGSHEFPFSNWHYIVANTDLLQGYGEDEKITPWVPEDTWVYKTEYRLPIMGEFYNITPQSPVGALEKIQEVDLYPYDTKDKYDIKPEEFPGGVIPKGVYLKIRERHKEEPYRTKKFLPALSMGRVANKVKVTVGAEVTEVAW